MAVDSAAPAVHMTAWALAHYEEPFYSQRTAKLPGKLARLGVLNLDRRSRILDAGCGKGEALAILRRYGFTNLAGADLLQHAEWRGIPDVRFEVCDATRTGFSDGEFDAIISLHALHHMASPEGVDAFLRECFRLLKPGGQVFVLDYPGSPQINLLHFFLRRRIGTLTRGLQNFARIQDEEWSFLAPYLKRWSAVHDVIRSSAFSIDQWRHGLFLYYLTLSKPLGENHQTSEIERSNHAWVQNYMDPQQHRRRRVEMRTKLERLGLADVDPGARIYDLCCGMGEALDTLYEMGFRNLHGVDLTPYPNLNANPRFEFTQGNVCHLEIADNSVDWIVNIHSLHHLENSENVQKFLDECYRVLRPGGRLAILDFPSSLQIQLAFHFFHLNPFPVTAYLKWFGKLVQSEWYFLPSYLSEWATVRRMLHEGSFLVESHHQRFFYYYLRLAKPG